ncbi:MAG: nuclear transport factor 2 family protein, partial [Verrucomicrobiales bacterium]
MTERRSTDPVANHGGTGILGAGKQGIPAPEARILTWFDRAWNEGEKSAVEELMSAEAEVLGLGTSVMNAAAFTETLRAYHQSFDQVLVEVVDLVCGGDEGAGHARFSARHRASGREVDFLFSFSVRFEDGRIVWL